LAEKLNWKGLMNEVHFDAITTKYIFLHNKFKILPEIIYNCFVRISISSPCWKSAFQRQIKFSTKQTNEQSSSRFLVPGSKHSSRYICYH